MGRVACAGSCSTARASTATSLVASGGRQPAYSLLAQAGARVEYDDGLGVFVPTELPAGVEAVGSVTGEGLSKIAPEPGYGGKGKCFVCVCEDVTTKDMKRAIGEGFDSIELAKRYTTATMGPCQGKLCQLSSIRVYAQENRMYESAIGTTTARPPWAPVELGLLAGRELTPARRGSIHWRHEEAGATIQWAGPWKRPYAYGEHPEDEVRAVHESLGVIDVSTLGKLFVEGPEAVALLERLYPNRFGDMKPGRIRYGVLTSDGGRIMDDGTIARLADDLFYVTTTSTGADAVTAWFEWWNAVWGYDAEIVNVTGALAAVNLAGPQARDALQRLTEADVSAEAFKYLDAHEIEVAGVPTLALRIGFVGELGYELHFPSPAGEHLWDRLVAEGARPFGLEPQRVLRLEKGHVIVGQDTDSESNLFSSGMSWLRSSTRTTSSASSRSSTSRQREEKERLVGFTMEENYLPAEGAQIVIEGFPAGRVTSARRSEAVGAGDRARVGADESVGAGNARGDPGRPAPARRAHHSRRVLRSRPGSGCAREPRLPLSARCAPRTTTSPLRRALEDADPAAVRDLSLEGIVEVRGNVDAVSAGAGEELLRLSSAPRLPLHGRRSGGRRRAPSCRGRTGIRRDRRARGRRDRERAGAAAADRPRPRADPDSRPVRRA